MQESVCVTQTPGDPVLANQVGHCPFGNHGLAAYVESMPTQGHQSLD